MDTQQGTTPEAGGAPLAQSPQTPAQESTQVPEESSSLGPIIGTIIIIAVIVIGGLYLYGKQVAKEEQSGLTPEEILSAEDPALSSLKEQGTSDEVADIEADLESSELDNLDAELNSLDLEFDI